MVLAQVQENRIRATETFEDLVKPDQYLSLKILTRQKIKEAILLW
jgi:hypothetical protein